jgi:hypothetical protein
MSFYVRRVVFLASWSLKLQGAALVKSVYPRISVLGCLGMPAGLLLLLFGTGLWILVFFLAPMLLIFVWMALQPYRLWLFLKSRTIGKRFSG